MSEQLKSIEELLNFNFKIETYQRGYRWDALQVFSLLKDLQEFTPEYQSFYCLQPLVVKMLDELNYELIDGQQRATTIFLILTYFKSEKFQLFYSTRNTNDDGLNDFLDSLNLLEIPYFEISNEIEDFEEFDAIVSSFWKDKIIIEKPEKNTVDNFYFYRSYAVIKNFFYQKNNEIQEDFKNKLLKQTKVIWYVENKDTTDKTIIKKFIDFNEGKIELEQAELIKALFVLDIIKTPNLIQRQYEENQFADDWNLIEHQMRDEKFWQFISNNKKDKNIANKINLLFQLYNGFGKNEDSFYNYRKFERAFDENSLSEVPKWESITQLYNGLEEWFHDRSTYHLIGTIIHVTNINISNILEIAEKAESKIKFRNDLRDTIRTFFMKNGEWIEAFNPSKVVYGNTAVTNLLLLYNIALTEIDEVDSFFPFYRFYDTNNWNIEHIMAKNDDGLDSFEEFSDFLFDIKSLVQSLNDKEISEENKSILSALCNELEEIIATHKKGDCKKKIIEINEKIKEFFSIDDFSNLCLLDQSTNIKVGKKAFRRKRNIVQKLDETIKIDQNVYIPLGTNYVFSKKSTPSEFYQINYWSTKDREFYLKKLEDTITNFLKLEENGTV
jgi:hypothetical protein